MEKRDEKICLYQEINKVVMNIYVKNTNELLCESFDDFLSQIQVSREVAEKFSLGVSGNEDQICNYIDSFDDLKKKKRWQEASLEMGLIKNGINGFYDSYKESIIFPIVNKFSKVVGFSTRKYNGSSLKPLYLNSPESVVFSRKNILYGENHVLKNDEVQQCIFLVEGFLDVMRLNSFGFANSMGLMGITIEDSCVKEIQLRFEKVYLALDNDDAGETASLRISEKFLALGLLPKLINLSPYKDPNEFLNRLGRDEFNKRIGCAEAKIKNKS